MSDLRTLPLASLEADHARLSGEIKTLSEEALGIERQIARLRSERTEIEREINRRMPVPSAEPKVTDHALVRYLERVLDLDVDRLRAGILTDEIVAAVRAGASMVSIHGVKFLVRGGALVTVIAPDKPTERRKPRPVGNYASLPDIIEQKEDPDGD